MTEYKHLRLVVLPLHSQAEIPLDESQLSLVQMSYEEKVSPPRGTVQQIYSDQRARSVGVQSNHKRKGRANLEITVRMPTKSRSTHVPGGGAWDPHTQPTIMCKYGFTEENRGTLRAGIYLLVVDVTVKSNSGHPTKSCIPRTKLQSRRCLTRRVLQSFSCKALAGGDPLQELLESKDTHRPRALR